MRSELRLAAWRVHHALEAVPLGRFSIRGNDGLTKAERDADVASFEARMADPYPAGMTPQQWSEHLNATLKPQPLPSHY
jgi:hypothetical protein